MDTLQTISLPDLKLLQLDILSAVDAFCLRHNINYWLDCGTLLGAIRHGGYIPWDDDIDIGMLRSDYDRFMSEFNHERGRYQFKCNEQDKTFLYSSGKVLDTHTILYEPDRNGQKLAVNIDVFVYDNAPAQQREVDRLYRNRDLLRAIGRQRIQSYRITGSCLKVLSGYLLRAVLKVFPKHFFIRRMIANSRKYVDVDTGMIGNFTSYTRIQCPKAWVEKCVRKRFEDREFNVPVGYDGWLKAFYKDYMTLPPVEKQVSHHYFEAYRLDTLPEG